jgi:aspartate 1-decarboxylase
MSHFTLLKSKIHRAAVTGSSLHYEGSLTVDEDLARKAGFLQYERILVGNINNGERFETYLIFGEPGSRVIELNGATAHLGAIGDRLTIMSFAQVPEEASQAHQPTIVRVDEHNHIWPQGAPKAPHAQASSE